VELVEAVDSGYSHFFITVSALALTSSYPFILFFFSCHKLSMFVLLL
jgi:hypothetical protein